MSDGKVTYEVRVDDSKIDQDMSQADSKVKSSGDKLVNTAKAAGLAIGLALVAAGAASVKFGQEFETAMAKTSTLIDTNTVDMKQLEKATLDLSDKTGIAASQLGETMYNALSAGVKLGEDGADMMAFLEKNAKLAVGGYTDIDTAVTATAKVMNAYKMSIEDTDRVHKILMQTQNNGIVEVGELGSVLANVTPTAAAMNVEFEQIGAALSNMTAQGTPAAQATTQLNSLFAELGKSGTQAQKALEKATEGTEYAGMSFQDMMKAGVPLNEVLDLMGAYATENGLSMLDMFSSIEAGKGALALSGENSAKYTENLKAMSTEVDVVGEAFEKNQTTAKAFSDMFNQIKNAAIELFISMKPLFETALPALGGVLSGLLGTIKDVLDFAQEHQTIMGLILIGITTLAVAIGAYTIAQNAAAIATAVATAATTAFGTVVAFLTSPITLVVLAIGALIAAAWLIYKNFDEIKAFLVGVWDAIVTEFTEFKDTLLTFFAELWESILTGLQEAWTALLDFLTTILTFLYEFLVTTFSNIVTQSVSVFRKILDGIGSIIDSIKGIFKGLTEFVAGVFSGDWQRAWNGVITIFGGALELIPGAIDSIKNIFKGLTEFVAGVFTSDWGRAWNGVITAFKGIINLIPGTIENVLNGVIGLINNAIDGINDVLDLIPGMPLLPNIPRVTVPKFHDGGIVNFGGQREGLALLEDGEMVLTRQHQADLLSMLSGAPQAATSYNKTYGDVVKKVDVGGIVVYGTPGMDPEALASYTIDKLRRELEG